MRESCKYKEPLKGFSCIVSKPKTLSPYISKPDVSLSHSSIIPVTQSNDAVRFVV